MPMSSRFSEMKAWCIANPGIGKFFALPSESRVLGINKWDEPIVENKSSWWFEDPYDAVLFKIQWSGGDLDDRTR